MRVSEFARGPRFYAPVYRDPMTLTSLWYPIGIHWVMKAWFTLRDWVYMSGLCATRRNREYHAIRIEWYQKGVDYGRQRAGEEHMREMDRFMLRGTPDRLNHIVPRVPMLSREDAMTSAVTAYVIGLCEGEQRTKEGADGARV